MGLIISTDEQVQEYFSRPELNQSTLKHLEKGYANFVKKQAEKEHQVDNADDKEAFIIGSGVDLILTGNIGSFEKKYYVSEIENKPSDIEMAIVKLVLGVLETYAEDTEVPNPIGQLSEYPGLILDACAEIGWQPNWKAPTRIAKIIEKCNLYFEDLKKAIGKIVISGTQKSTIDLIAMSLATNPRTLKYFDREVISRDGTVDVYYQKIIYFTYRGVACKAMLDIVYVFKLQNGSIHAILPFDLKTMAGQVVDFPFSIKMRRYDIQAVWYTLALSAEFEVSTADISNFQFIVESSTHPGEPRVFRMSDSLMEIGLNGRQSIKLIDTNFLTTFEKENEVFSGWELVRPISGINTLMDDFIWYEEHSWEQNMLLFQSNEVLDVDWNGIVIQS